MERWSLAMLFAGLMMLSPGAAALAGDNGPAKSTVSNAPAKTTTQSLMGKGTPASAAASGDSELTWYHAYRRGYRNGYYAGIYGGLGGYYAGYPYVTPYYPVGVSYYYTTPAYVPPAVSFYGQFGRVAVGLGINGRGSDVVAPPQPLNQTAPAAPAVQPTPNRYDGGPALPVPLPRQDGGSPNSQAAPPLPADAGLPVSLNKNPAKPAKPYAYKGYGEK